MSAPATISVDNDLASCEPSVSLWASNDELSRRVDVKMGVITVQRECRLAVLQLDLLKALHNHMLLDILVHHLHGRRSHLCSPVALAFLAALSLRWLSVLRRNDNCVNLQRLHGAIVILLVLDCHLSLAIGPQPPQRTVLADICQLLAQAGCNEDCQGHANFGLIRCISKHDALVPCAHVHLVLANVNTTCNVRTLPVDPNKNLASLVTDTLAVHAVQGIRIGVIADALHCLTHNLIIVELGRGGDFTKDHDHVVLASALARVSV